MHGAWWNNNVLNICVHIHGGWRRRMIVLLTESARLRDHAEVVPSRYPANMSIIISCTMPAVNQQLPYTDVVGKM